METTPNSPDSKIATQTKTPVTFKSVVCISVTNILSKEKRLCVLCLLQHNAIL